MQGYLRINLSADQKASLPNSLLPASYRTTIVNSKGDNVYSEDVLFSTATTDDKGLFVKTVTFDLPADSYVPTVQLIDKDGKLYGTAITGSFTISETAINLPGSIEFVQV